MVLVSPKVQSSDVQLAVKLAWGAAGTGGTVTVTCRAKVPSAPALSATCRVTLYVLAAAKVCDVVAVVVPGDASPKFQPNATMASPTSWSVLMLVKVQVRSTQETAKFAVGAVFTAPAPALIPPPPPPPPHADKPRADRSSSARIQFVIDFTLLYLVTLSPYVGRWQAPTDRRSDCRASEGFFVVMTAFRMAISACLGFTLVSAASEVPASTEQEQPR